MLKKYTYLVSLAAALSAAGFSVCSEASLIPDFPEKEALLSDETGAEAASEAVASSSAVAGEATEAITEGPDAEPLSEEQTEQTEQISEGSLPEAEDAAAGADHSEEDEDAGKNGEGAGPESGGALLPAFTYLEGPFYLCPGYILPPAARLPEPTISLALLSRELEKMTAAYDGTWSVAVKDLSTGEQTVIGDTVMPSASTLKLFILGCIYDEIAEGRLERTEELVSLMNSMIRASSNEAANRLIAILGGNDHQAGIDRINAYLDEKGYSEATRAYNPFQDQSLKLDPDHVNTTSAADCMLLLERIYRRQFGSRKVCNETEDMLLNQELRYKIPKGLGETALAANKTGETDDIENDIALVFTPKGDYILCVFSTGWSDKKAAQSRITEISAKTYSYFADPETFMTVPPELKELNSRLSLPGSDDAGYLAF